MIMDHQFEQFKFILDLVEVNVKIALIVEKCFVLIEQLVVEVLNHFLVETVRTIENDHQDDNDFQFSLNMNERLKTERHFLCKECFI